MGQRVVVSGLGVVAPGGIGKRNAWEAVLSGKSPIQKIEQFDPSGLPVQHAAEIQDFDPSLFFDEKQLRRVTRFIQFAVVAADEALIDAGLLQHTIAETIGCCIGVGMGALDFIEEQSSILKAKGPKRVSPFFIPYTIANMASGEVAMRYNLQGPNLCPTTACTSGTHGVGEAFKMIQSGRAKVMVSGGAEAAICPIGMAGFSSLKALATNFDDEQAASRPFDLNRTGFVMGEGAGILVLEEYEHAKKRGARIYAEIVGYGTSADAHHITSPSPEGEGAQRCMRSAIEDAGISKDEIGYINAHGTSTKLNDLYESIAIQKVFGDDAKKLKVSSTKGVTGHCLGAAGGIEALYSVLALEKGVLPPTANYLTPDPDCPLDYIPNEPQEIAVKYAMSNSFGFGGTNGSVLFRKF